jgi:Holliday junction DNA helicase RuvA
VIASLRGILQEKKPDAVVVDVHGVGYHLLIPLSTFYKLPDPGTEHVFHVHTHVREDQITLFGFHSRRELDIFHALLSVRGCGPRMALTVLSGMETEALLQCLVRADVAGLSRIPGIGPKTADRLVYELKEKLSRYLEISAEPAATAEQGALPPDMQEDLVSAMVNLGYNRSQAEKALVKAAEDDPEAGFETLLKRSLRRLMAR